MTIIQISTSGDNYIVIFHPDELLNGQIVENKKLFTVNAINKITGESVKSAHLFVTKEDAEAAGIAISLNLIA